MIPLQSRHESFLKKGIISVRDIGLLGPGIILLGIGEPTGVIIAIAYPGIGIGKHASISSGLYRDIPGKTVEGLREVMLFELTVGPIVPSQRIHFAPLVLAGRKICRIIPGSDVVLFPTILALGEPKRSLTPYIGIIVSHSDRPAKQTFGIGDTGIGESLRPQLEKNALLGGEYFPVGLPYFIDRRQCRPIITGRHVNFYQIVVNLVGIARTGKLVQETFEHTHRVIERRSRAIIQAERIVVKRRFPNLTVVIPL